MIVFICFSCHLYVFISIFWLYQISNHNIGFETSISITIITRIASLLLFIGVTSFRIFYVFRLKISFNDSIYQLTHTTYKILIILTIILAIPLYLTWIYEAIYQFNIILYEMKAVTVILQSLVDICVAVLFGKKLLLLTAKQCKTNTVPIFVAGTDATQARAILAQGVSRSREEAISVTKSLKTPAIDADTSNININQNPSSNPNSNSNLNCAPTIAREIPSRSVIFTNVLSQRQHTLIHLITKQTLLSCIVTLTAICVSIVLLISSFRNTVVTYFTLLCGNVIICCALWLSFVFADNEYQCLCRLCHGCCLKCFQSVAICSIKQSLQDNQDIQTAVEIVANTNVRVASNYINGNVNLTNDNDHQHQKDVGGVDMSLNFSTTV